MEQKTFKTINTVKCHYVYDKNAQKLIQMEPVSIEFDLETGECVQRFNLGGEMDVAIDINNDFYESEEAFKNGRKLTPENATSDLNMRNIMYWVFESRYIQEDQDNGAYVWTYENGEATKWKLEEHTKKVLIVFKDPTTHRRKAILDCQLPDAYRNAEEVYNFNDYTVQDGEGNVEVREGLYKRLRLSDDQNKLVDKLQEAVNECKKAGIALVFDMAEYELMAFNEANIKEFAYDPMVGDDEEAHYLNLSKARSINGIIDVNTDDDCCVFLIERRK